MRFSGAAKVEYAAAREGHDVARASHGLHILAEGGIGVARWIGLRPFDLSRNSRAVELRGNHSVRRAVFEHDAIPIRQEIGRGVTAVIDEIALEPSFYQRSDDIGNAIVLS